jgi:thymidine kinase
MYTEPKKDKGWIEVICGSMFSGKTEELIRRTNRAKIAQQKVVIFKPELDHRYGVNDVVSHNSNKTKSIPIKYSSRILDHFQNEEVIAIDEAQFFDDELPQVCEQLARKGVRVIVAGLDMDSNAQPFGPMPTLLATAEFVTKLHAICMHCNDIASHTFKKIYSEKHIELGEKDLYEALCRKCFVNGMAKLKDQIRLDI